MTGHCSKCFEQCCRCDDETHAALEPGYYNVIDGELFKLKDGVPCIVCLRLKQELAAAEKTIRTLARQMISDAEYTAKLLDKSLGASTMTSGQMAIKAIEELKKGK